MSEDLSFEDVDSMVFHVSCVCGEELEIDLDGWEFEINGNIGFKCPCEKEANLSECDIGIGEDVPSTDIHVLCKCGRVLKINLHGWKLEIEGTLGFKCPCGEVWKSDYNDQ